MTAANARGDHPVSTPCRIPKCNALMDRWPDQCGRPLGHDGEHGPPNPFLVGDPWWGTLVCRVCGGEIHADEPYRKVKRFWWFPGQGGWRYAFAHDANDGADHAVR